MTRSLRAAIAEHSGQGGGLGSVRPQGHLIVNMDAPVRPPSFEYAPRCWGHSSRPELHRLTTLPKGMEPRGVIVFIVSAWPASWLSLSAPLLLIRADHHPRPR